MRALLYCRVSLTVYCMSRRSRYVRYKHAPRRRRRGASNVTATHRCRVDGAVGGGDERLRSPRAPPLRRLSAGLAAAGADGAASERLARQPHLPLHVAVWLLPAPSKGALLSDLWPPRWLSRAATRGGEGGEGTRGRCRPASRCCAIAVERYPTGERCCLSAILRLFASICCASRPKFARAAAFELPAARFRFEAVSSRAQL